MSLARIEKILLLLTILLLPTQLGKHFWPPYSFIYSLPIDYLSPTLFIWDLPAVLLCITFVIQNKHINRTALNLAYLFILSQAVSMLSFGVSIGAGLVRLEQYLIAGLFGVYIASSDLNKIKTILIWALGLSLIGESLLSTAQFIKGGTLGLWILGERTFSLSTPGIAKFDFYGQQFLRPYATLPHPNVLAGFLIIETIILGLFSKKIISFPVTTLSGLVVLLTVSRAALTAGLVAAMILVNKKIKVLLIVLVLLSLPILYTRFASILNFDNLTLVRREELSRVALNLWLKSPILGVGLNNFIPAASNLLLSGPSRFLQPVHNILLLSLSETGLLGLFGLLVLLGYPIFKLYKLNPKPYPLYPILVCWGVLIFLSLFDHYFLTLPQGYRLLFLLWGLSFAHAKIKG